MTWTFFLLLLCSLQPLEQVPQRLKLHEDVIISSKQRLSQGGIAPRLSLRKRTSTDEYKPSLLAFPITSRSATNKGQAMDRTASSGDDKILEPHPEEGERSPSEPTSTPPAANCSFLALPLKLRNKIYEKAVTRTTNIHGQCVIDRGEFATYQALVRTCRQIYHECTAVFFEVNVFYFEMDSSEEITRFEKQPAIKDRVDKLKNIIICASPALSGYKVDLSSGCATYIRPAPLMFDLQELDVFCKERSDSFLAEIFGTAPVGRENYPLTQSSLETLKKVLREA